MDKPDIPDDSIDNSKIVENAIIQGSSKVVIPVLRAEDLDFDTELNSRALLKIASEQFIEKGLLDTTEARVIESHITEQVEEYEDYRNITHKVKPNTWVLHLEYLNEKKYAELIEAVQNRQDNT